MKTNIFWPLLVPAIILMLIQAPSLAAEDPKCALAGKIGKEAAGRFKKDKRDGLRLFLKAHEYCPDDALTNFNLGLAFYRYGNLKEAEGYLHRAVSKGQPNAEWLNLLAWVMLENRSDKGRALEYAERAIKLNPGSPAISDTLIRSYRENGRLYDAALTAKKCKDQWPNDKKIAQRYDSVLDDYISDHLAMTKAGKHKEALEGLKRIDFDADAVNAYCWSLFGAGKTEDALREARNAGEKFAGAGGLKDTFDQIMDRFIQSCYRRFKEGKRENAVLSVDRMRQIHPGYKALEEAYQAMFKAVLADADTITVPEPIRIAEPKRPGKEESGRLLSELQGGKEGVQVDMDDLIVDVDRDIPECRAKNPHGIAVIIGNKRYSRFGHGLPDVDYAERDAAVMKKYIINVFGYKEENIIYEHNVTQGQLSKIFGTKENFRGQLCNWVRPEESEVFIYYSGHGAPDPGGKGAFLVPVDADVDYISANGYPLDTFYNNLAKIPAKRMTIVLDACFSGDSARGMLFKKVSPAILKSANPVKEMKNAVIFASAGKDQVSHWWQEKQHSLFTYFFMKGLKGEADGNGDKRITVAEMKAYLSDKVPYRARRLAGREQAPIVVGDVSWELARLR